MRDSTPDCGARWCSPQSLQLTVVQASSQLFDNSATKGFFFFDRQLTYSCLSHSSSVLAANDCRVVLTFLQRSPSFSLASASLVQHDNESWHARQRVYLTNTYNLNSYDSRTRAWADVFTQKKPYHNVARQSCLIFSIFLHQIWCGRVQSIFNLNKVRGLPHNALHFPSTVKPVNYDHRRDLE